jgi:hypothetical protein
MSNQESTDVSTPGMGPALRKKFEEIQELFAHASREDALTRHRIGVLVAGVRDQEKTYGTRAVQTLADALGCNRTTLYRYAVVADNWSRPSLQRLLARRTAHGGSLTWSHLMVLAGVKDARDRDAMTERALAEGWSVDALARAIARGSSALSAAAADSPTLAKLEQFIAVADSIRRRAVVDDDLLDALEGEDVLAFVQKAIRLQREAQEICARNVERLEAVRQRIKRGNATLLAMPLRKSAARGRTGAVSALAGGVCSGGPQ